MLALLTATAMAGSVSGPSTPNAGGPLSMVTETSLLGFPINPASLPTSKLEVCFDLGVLNYRLSEELLGPEESTLAEPLNHPISGTVGPFTGTTPIPSLSVAGPLSDQLSAGLLLFVPYGSGGNFDEEGPQRFRAITGAIVHVEVDAGLQWHWNNLMIGAAYRGIYSTFDSYTAVDNGQTLAMLTGDSSLMLQPLFEGRQTVSGSGTGHGYALGLHYVHQQFGLHASYRSSVNTQLTGQLEQTFSQDLTFAFAGELELTIPLPAQTNIGLSWSSERFRLMTEISHNDWSGVSRQPGVAKNLEVISEDPLLDQLLQDYGISDLDELVSDQDISRFTGQENIVSIGGGAGWWITKTLELYSGVWHHPDILPDKYTHASNFDFEVIESRNVLTWKPSIKQGSPLVMLLSYTHLFSDPSTISEEESVYQLNCTDESCIEGLSGAGTYDFSMGRFGATVKYSF